MMENFQAHILYVDDEQENLNAFRSSFRRSYEVHTARSGQEALDLLDREPIGLVISDQRMPGMTGVDLFEAIQATHPDPVRIILTGFSDVQAIVNAINKGKVWYYVTKPWKHEELKVIIDNGLEAYRLRQENRSLQLLAERRKREQLLAQFETLKNQVNPHFLFNCLNVLSSLLQEDVDLAETFITTLTRVYRYVLDIRDAELVSLGEELQFVKSYLFLHQIRFGNSLQVYLEVPAEYETWQLPPLTLQMLAENAVKHNVISREHPLTIEMAVEAPATFTVRNTFQPRQDPAGSTGIGLANLLARYQFLTDQVPVFGAAGGLYVAQVPLLPRQAGPEAAPGRKF
ncbi:MAG: histidine kinase [Bacteroidia bacterium]|nr:histidine kinase [Bacteroidia bacterium]